MIARQPTRRRVTVTLALVAALGAELARPSAGTGPTPPGFGSPARSTIAGRSPALRRLLRLQARLVAPRAP